MTLASRLAENWGRAYLAPPSRTSRSGTAGGASSVPSARSAILAVGSAHDEHLDLIQEEMAGRGLPLTRWNIDDLSAPNRFAVDPGEREAYRAVVCRAHSAGVRVAYHNEHAIRVPNLWPDLPRNEYRFAERELAAGIMSRLDGVEADVWLNDPWAADRAELKVRQLRAAAAEGLNIPRTLITDCPKRVLGFAEQVGTVVYKSLQDPVVTEGEGEALFLYTTPLTSNELDELDSLLVHPGIFQEALPAVVEHRVTVVGDHCFVATLNTENCAPDWRRRLPGTAPFRRGVLSDPVTSAVVALVEKLGLRFAGVDLLETLDKLYFLEINPSGAWSWLERHLDLPVTRSICDLLTREVR